MEKDSAPVDDSIETTNSKPDRSNQGLRALRNRPILCSASYFALAYFIQGITDIASGFVNLPLQTLLKDQLGLSPTQMSGFFFTCTITWSIKPLYGLLSDFVPIFGYHRLSYLVLTTIINLIAWISLYFIPIDYKYLLIFCVLAAFSLAFNDVLIDALMIRIGRPLAIIGTLQGIQQTAAKLATTIAQIPAGMLASQTNLHSFKIIFLIAAICPIVLFIFTISIIRESRRKLNRANLHETWSSLIDIFRYKHFWLVTIFICIYSASPQVKTSLFYYQRDYLQLNAFFISILNTLYNGFGIVSALIYLTFFSHHSAKSILRVTILMRVCAIASHLLIRDKISSILIAIFTGLCSEITNLAVLHLAAKSCPKNVEGTLFALFVSCVNFGGATGDRLGSTIYERFGFFYLNILAMIWVGVTIIVTWFVKEDGFQTQSDNKNDNEAPNENSLELNENNTFLI